MIDLNKIELHETWKHVNPYKKDLAIEGIKQLGGWINSLKLTDKKVGLRLMPFIARDNRTINVVWLEDISFLVLTVKYSRRTVKLTKESNLDMILQHMVKVGMVLANKFADVKFIKKIESSLMETGDDSLDPSVHNERVLIHEYIHFYQILSRGQMDCYHPTRKVQSHLHERCAYVLGSELYDMYQIYKRTLK